MALLVLVMQEHYESGCSVSVVLSHGQPPKLLGDATDPEQDCGLNLITPTIKHGSS